ncbi:MAG: polyketide synthase dehydratase domain-containing protein [Deltaproteobacteria bacterium]|nr:polyketide synthase dehydratase domain-containing protein [Deltaproteobacteria bacterium]
MENLSTPVEKIAIPLAIPLPAYLCDHHIGGLAVLPAVEALQNVARSKPAAWGGDLCRQERAVFPHLLIIDPGAGEIPALHEHALYADGRCLSRLTTLRSGRRRKLNRRMEHVNIWFMPGKQGAVDGPEAEPPAKDFPPGKPFVVSEQRLYDELVPFGPAYRNVKGGIMMTQDGVAATVYGGDFPGAEGPLGSSFPLDAAMHVACVWGQRYRNRVVFPVGFDRRDILIPTRAEKIYLCHVKAIPGDGAVLRFDVRLYDRDRRLVEAVRGLMMRDIGGEKQIPPAWIREVA